MRIKQIYKKLTVATADQGFAFLPTVSMPSITGVAASLVSSANQKRAVQFVLPFQLKVAVLQWYVTTGESDKYFGCGIYDTNRQRIFETEETSLASTVKKKITLPTPVTLNAGVYWLAWTADSLTARIWGIDAHIYRTALFNDTNPQIGTCGTTGIPGVLGGSISAPTYSSIDVPFILMKP
jgi:hypothetical protein